MSTMTAAVRSNPFYQPPRQWQIQVFVDREHVPAIEEALLDVSLAVLSFELDEATAAWRVDVITDTSPEQADIPSRLALMAGLMGVSTPRYEVHPLESKDWVSEVEQSFPPLNVGRFYVHGSHVKSAAPHGKLALRIDAGEAFGSGEHATTSGCLLALTLLAKRRKFTRTLDMGCGSGILALAMAKLWKRPVTGIDIDPVSVTVARRNAYFNRVHTLAVFAAGDGYRSVLVRKSAPFDLIVSNILARPLVKMAPRLKANLAAGGVIVLSGLLASQERMVLAAHRMQGLRLMARICQNGWNTLILSDSARP